MWQEPIHPMSSKEFTCSSLDSLSRTDGKIQKKEKLTSASLAKILIEIILLMASGTASLKSLATQQEIRFNVRLNQVQTDGKKESLQLSGTKEILIGSDLTMETKCIVQIRFPNSSSSKREFQRKSKSSSSFLPSELKEINFSLSRNTVKLSSNTMKDLLQFRKKNPEQTKKKTRFLKILSCASERMRPFAY